MTITTVANTDTFGTWVTRTDQIIVLMNNLTDTTFNSNNFIANTISAINWIQVSGINVAPAISGAYTAANSVPSAFVRANNSWGYVIISGTDSTYNWSNVSPGNVTLTATNSANTLKLINGIGLEIDVDSGNNAIRLKTGAYDKANSADIDAVSAFTSANTAQNVAQSAFAYANSVASGGAAGAYNRANASWSTVFLTGTDTTYNWANVSPGNISINATNSANTLKMVVGGGLEVDIDTGNNALRFKTGAYAAANTAEADAQTGITNAGKAFDKANTADTDALNAGAQANAAFGKANTANTDAFNAGAQANIAFNKANTADTDAIAAFGVANTGNTYANSLVTTQGTAPGIAVAPAGLAGSVYGRKTVEILCSSPTSNLANTTGIAYLRIPKVLDGWNVSTVGAHLSQPSSGSGSLNVKVQIINTTNSANLRNVLSTQIDLDVNIRDTVNTNTQPVISTSNNTVNHGNEYRIDVVDAGSNAKGLIVDITFILAGAT